MGKKENELYDEINNQPISISDYKKSIMKILDEITDEKFLRRVFIIVSDYIKEKSG